MDEVRMAKIQAAADILEKFLMDYEAHLKDSFAGIAHGPEWIMRYPARFVDEIELVGRIVELKMGAKIV